MSELRASKKPDSYDFGLLLLDTGMRYMDAETIPWSAVDMDAKTITVYRHKVKNESILAMTDRVFTMMEQRCKLKGKYRYVFMSNDGKTHRKCWLSVVNLCHQNPFQFCTWRIIWACTQFYVCCWGACQGVFLQNIDGFNFPGCSASF